MNTPMNVDKGEIAKFEALASRWWDAQGEFRPLHEINPLRANYIDQHSPVHGRRLLDVGCGGGILAEAMARRGAEVTAIDMGEAPLAVARMPASFDVVCCLEMLEHVPDPAAVVGACAELVRPGGTLYFSTINRNPKAFLFAIVGAEHILRLLPAGTHEYEKFIRPSELAQWIRAAGLQLEGMTGLTYNPLTRRYRLVERDVSVNYMVRAGRPA